MNELSRSITEIHDENTKGIHMIILPDENRRIRSERTQKLI